MPGVGPVGTKPSRYGEGQVLAYFDAVVEVPVDQEDAQQARGRG
ncbi:hypothetical protein [Carbonactinospora thermoautotrophica]|nr:hypothetical protein [Carbonactinospora thermoautotrophica]